MLNNTLKAARDLFLISNIIVGWREVSLQRQAKGLPCGDGILHALEIIDDIYKMNLQDKYSFNNTFHLTNPFPLDVCVGLGTNLFQEEGNLHKSIYVLNVANSCCLWINNKCLIDTYEVHGYVEIATCWNEEMFKIERGAESNNKMEI